MPQGALLAAATHGHLAAAVVADHAGSLSLRVRDTRLAPSRRCAADVCVPLPGSAQHAALAWHPARRAVVAHAGAAAIGVVLEDGAARTFALPQPVDVVRWAAPAACLAGDAVLVSLGGGRLRTYRIAFSDLSEQTSDTALPSAMLEAVHTVEGVQSTQNDSLLFLPDGQTLLHIAPADGGTARVRAYAGYAGVPSASLALADRRSLVFAGEVVGLLRGGADMLVRGADGALLAVSRLDSSTSTVAAALGVAEPADSPPANHSAAGESFQMRVAVEDADCIVSALTHGADATLRSFLTNTAVSWDFCAEIARVHAATCIGDSVVGALPCVHAGRLTAVGLLSSGRIVTADATMSGGEVKAAHHISRLLESLGAEDVSGGDLAAIARAAVAVPGALHPADAEPLAAQLRAAAERHAGTRAGRSCASLSRALTEKTRISPGLVDTVTGQPLTDAGETCPACGAVLALWSPGPWWAGHWRDACPRCAAPRVVYPRQT